MSSFRAGLSAILPRSIRFAASRSAVSRRIFAALAALSLLLAGLVPATAQEQYYRLSR